MYFDGKVLEVKETEMGELPEVEFERSHHVLNIRHAISNYRAQGRHERAETPTRIATGHDSMADSFEKDQHHRELDISKYATWKVYNTRAAID